MTIRPARDDDFAAIAAITNHYIATTTIHFGHEPVTEDELRAAWREGSGCFPWFVTLGDDGTVAGYAKAGSFRARAAYRWTTETGIYLAPAMLGRGLGRPLYRTLLDELQVRGFHSAIGGIALPNVASVRLHERLGFVHVGTIREAGWKFGAWHDVGFWQLGFAGQEVPPPGGSA
ncbi:MAG: N-acetyltransferase [Planctomycetes bacterium]|nr:N-acetyltransferase [Planctomycetota bacterium]